MKKYVPFLFAMAVALAFVPAVLAQTPTGTIEGSVTDPQGAVVAGANVAVTEKATGRTITSTTNDQGYYTVPSLSPGVYGVRIEKTGFSTANVETVVVQVGLVARADVGLKLGSQSEVVQVDIGATDVQVDTTRQTLDGVVTARQITALPLNARNFLDLAGLQPGVTVVDGGNIDPTKVNAYRAVQVNGGSGTGTRVQLEGIDVTDETVGTTTANFSTDAVQEFNLSRSSFDLSTSLTTSGAVSIAGRTGGNKFSGSGFYFKQDDRFDARPSFEAEKLEFNRDQEGYRFGGPFIKDKLFFFSNFERFNQANFASFTSGDFPQFNSASALPIKTRFAMNRLDWVATDKLKVFYLHNFNDDSSTGGGIRSPFQNIDWTNMHIIGANWLGSSRFTHTFRFGLVNFNNRIESQELSGFEFPQTPQGIRYQLNVGDISIGPNGLAPQQTYQNNYQGKYDGSAVLGKHLFRFGGEVNRFILGGFANFAGPLTITGLLPPHISNNPLDYPLQEFSTGPNAGFFTARPAHNLPFGGKYNTRWAAYVGDQWKIRNNLTLNLGVRYNYETNFFSSPDAPRLPQLDRYGAGLGDTAKFPKDAFSPQVGFAWDVFGNGKTSVRGGFYLAYEANIFNNSLFDEFARITTGIGPTVLFGSDGNMVGPNGAAINIGPNAFCTAAETAAGDYTCLLGHPISSVLPILGQLHQAVQAAYANLSNYNPTAGPSEFQNTNGVTFGGQIPGDYKIPYGMQFNIGVQRELFKGHVLSVDYVRHRGVGLPIMLADLERRRDSQFFNAAAALSNRNAFLVDCGRATVDDAINLGCTDGSHPGIADFGVSGGGVWPGLGYILPASGPNPNLTRARVMVGGFSLYQGIQVSLNGRVGEDTFKFLSFGNRSLLHGLTYNVGYALSQNKSTSGSGRPEFIANTTKSYNFNDDFGPSGLDRLHNLSIGASLDLIGGFRLDQTYKLSTSPPVNLFVPNNVGADGIFTADLNGDGGVGGATIRNELLPGTNIGAFGRSVGSISELNKLISDFNTNFAGKLTPHGQRLVAAGVFTLAQMAALGGVIQAIPLVPSGNPDPFHTRFYADYRLSRPIKIWKENWLLEPSFSVFNVFNNAAKGTYAGLDGTCGALNHDYAADPGCNLGSLDRIRGLAVPARRQLQFGIRFSF